MHPFTGIQIITSRNSVKRNNMINEVLLHANHVTFMIENKSQR